jgi:hypothetical protein
MTTFSTPARQAEIAAVPEFNGSAIRIVAGLVLPIWKRLPNESIRACRLHADAGERIIGRKVSPARVTSALTIDAPVLTPDDIFAPPMVGQTIFNPAQGFQLRRVCVMGANPIELAGFSDTLRDRLKAYGLFHEIILWMLRMFAPTEAAGVAVLSRVLDRYPIERSAERGAV